MCWMISRIALSRPPGVFIVIRTRLASDFAASSIPLLMYSASTGSTTSSMRSSTTRASRPASSSRPAGGAPFPIVGRGRNASSDAANTPAANSDTAALTFMAPTPSECGSLPPRS